MPMGKEDGAWPGGDVRLSALSLGLGDGGFNPPQRLVKYPRVRMVAGVEIMQ